MLCPHKARAIHTYTFTYIPTYLHTYILTYLHTYILIHTYKPVYIHTYMHACMHTCIHTYTHIHTCIHTYRQTDIQTDRHTNIQTYRHTDIQTYRSHFGSSICDLAATCFGTPVKVNSVNSQHLKSGKKLDGHMIQRVTQESQGLSAWRVTLQSKQASRRSIFARHRGETPHICFQQVLMDYPQNYPTRFWSLTQSNSHGPASSCAAESTLAA